MRLSIFTGLLYVAWCINPKAFDNQMVLADYVIIIIVISVALIGDIKDLLHANNH